MATLKYISSNDLLCCWAGFESNLEILLFFRFGHALNFCNRSNEGLSSFSIRFSSTSKRAHKDDIWSTALTSNWCILVDQANF